MSNDDDYYMAPKSNNSFRKRRLSAYSLREEESIVSAEEETSYHVGVGRRRRKRYVHQRSSRRADGYELIEEKPMDEVIVRGGDNIIDLQAERDSLMAEYGRLYGIKSVILEKRAQVETELRGMEFATKLLTDAASGP
jgi:hypothetical protein